MVLAAIDIGSNAARLLISELMTAGPDATFKKQALIRVPTRLGFDVFESGYITIPRETKLMHTMKAFHHLMEAYGVDHYAAYATSAMRDAENAMEVIQNIHEETGIHIGLLTGSQEAQLILSSPTVLTERKNPLLFIDVGGGSTELCVVLKDRILFKDSFNIGTIRLLKSRVNNNEWKRLKDFLKMVISSHKNIQLIGLGGNINKVFDMSGLKLGKALNFILLRTFYQKMKGISIEKRILKDHLKSDRADVIVPALEIYLNIMKWIGIEKISVPKTGLVDGIISNVYLQHSRSLPQKNKSCQ